MMRGLALAAIFSCACQVYDSSLLVSVDGGADSPVEACATLCKGQCADLQSDQNNCGACGTTCEAGCSAGLCKPTVLATGLGAPHGLLQNGSSLYFANHGTISVQVMSKIDGTGLKNFGTSQLFPERLATDGANLFWTDTANVPTTPGGTVEYGNFDMTTQCAPGFLVCYVVQNLPSPFGLAIQGQNMFVTTLDATNNGASGCAGMYVNAVLQCPTFGCNVNNCGSGGPNVIATGTKLASVAADATNMYWADTGAHVINFCPQPTCTNGPTTFAGQLDQPFDVVSDGAHVYFTDRGAGTLSSCPITGCGTSRTILTSSIKDPLLIALDSKTIYVTSYAGGTISSCDLPTCAGGAKVIAKGLKAPYGIAIDSTYVYWTEEGSAGVASQDGTVSKLRRQ